MSTRQREATAALDGARRSREQNEPDLFSTNVEKDWREPASPTERWKADALERVRLVAVDEDSLTVETIDWPPHTENKARGAILVSAARRGWIVADGWERGNASRHNRPVRRWRSRLRAGP